MNYIIISAARNEEKNIEETINSVISQTIRPLEWVIVNDGSNDSTAKIIDNFSRKHEWIRILNKEDKGNDNVGKGVIEAFNYGYRSINSEDWSFVVKLDCDLKFDNEFFEIIFRRFNDNEKLGITGGTSFFLDKNDLKEERVPDFHPMACARIYRKKCFEDIGGLVENLGWDTIDLLRAQMKGWETKRFTDLKIIHLRRMSSRKGLWEGKLRLGRNFYVTGYHPIFLIARSIYRLKEKPYFVEFFGVIIGYLLALFKRDTLVVNSNEKKFLQRQQLRRLIGLKI